jgi:hypothetical protein
MNNYLLAFMPRVGFAYAVGGSGKTSIRGGSGIFYDSRQSGFFNTRFADVSPFSPQIALTPPPGPFSNPLLGAPSPLPAPFPPAAGVAFVTPVVAASFPPGSHFDPPVTYNWNLTIERQVTKQWLARAAYVGSHSSHLTVCLEENPAVYISGSKLTDDQRRIFQPYSNIQEAADVSNAHYEALQLSTESRFSQKFSVQANYTWSKSLDNLPVGGYAGGPQLNNSWVYPWYFKNADLLDRGPSDFDIRQRFVLSYVWRLPMLNNRSALLRGPVGGWQLTGLLQAQSGPPLTIMSTNQDESATGLMRDRGVITGAPYGSGACGNIAPCVGYLNPTSFAQPQPGGFGNVGKGSLRAPGTVTWDMGIFKNFPIHEGIHLQCRAEFFNALNRANFSAPTSSVGSPAFGGIVSAGNPRVGQLALKMIF